MITESPLKIWTVPLLCIFCRQHMDWVQSTYKGASHGICRAEECQKKQAEAMRNARRGR